MSFNTNMSLSEALCEATHQAMHENEKIFVIGEGVTDQKQFLELLKILKINLEMIEL